MKSVNSGVLLGLDPTKMDDLAKAATRLGQAVGREAGPALDDLILGLARGSPKILDNIGITLDADAAYRKYADANHVLVKNLTETEKKLAVQAEALLQAKIKTEQLGPPIVNAATEFGRLGVALENSKQGFANFIANSDSLEFVLRRMGNTVTNVSQTLRFLFSSDQTAQAARLVQQIEVLRNGPQVVRGVKTSDLADQKQAELDTIIAGINKQGEAEKKVFEEQRKAYDEKNKKQIEAERAAMAATKAQKEADSDTKESAKAAIAAIEELTKKRNELAAQAQSETDLLGLKKAIQSGDGAGIKQFADRINKDTEAALKASLSTALGKAGEGGKAAALFAEIVGKEIEASIAKATADSAKSIAGANADFAAAQIDAALDKAYEKGDFAGIKVLQQKIHDAAVKEISDAETERLIKSGLSYEKAITQANEIANAKAQEGDLQRAQHLQEALNEAYQGNVDVFTDLITTAVDGDIGDAFKDMLKRVAISFAAQIAAGLAAQIGLTGLANLGSAGLGQSLAASLQGALGGQTGGVAGIGGYAQQAQQAYGAYQTFFGGATAAQGSGNLIGPTLQNGSFYSTGAAPASSAAGGFSYAGAASTLGYAAAAYGLYDGGSSLYSNLTDNKKDVKGGAISGAEFGAAAGGLATVAAAAYAGATIGSVVPVVGTIIGAAVGAVIGIAIGSTGGDPKLAFERQQREKALDQIQDNTPIGQSLTFAGVKGPLTLNEDNFNIDQSNPLSAQAVAFANPLAQSIVGGDGKLSSDLAAIFANATDDADNLNEVLANTLSLMDGLGVTSDEVKKSLSDSFLDGKISAESFGAGLQQLNILATEALIGPDSIAEALAIIAKNIDGEGDDSPRTALKGLELEFKALAAAGFDSTEEIVGYFDSIGKSDIGDFFEQIGALGVDSFDDIATAIEQNPDLVFALYDALVSMNGVLAETNTSGIESIGGAATASAAKLGRLNNALDESIKKQDQLSRLAKNTPSASSGSGDSGAPLNTLPR